MRLIYYLQFIQYWKQVNTIFKEALEFATSINYTHPGLSSKSYLKHPMRVAKLIANISTKPSIECLIIALLHNIFETSEISADLLCEKI